VKFNLSAVQAAVDLVAEEISAIGPMPLVRNYGPQFDWIGATRSAEGQLQAALDKIAPFQGADQMLVYTGAGSTGLSAQVFTQTLVRIIGARGGDFAKEAIAKLLTASEATVRCHTVAWGFTLTDSPCDLGDGLSVTLMAEEVANQRYNDWSVPFHVRGVQPPAVFTRNVEISSLIHRIADADKPRPSEVIEAHRRTSQEVYGLSVLGSSPAVIEESSSEFADEHLRALFPQGKYTPFQEILPLQKIEPIHLDRSAQQHLSHFRALAEPKRQHLVNVIDRVGSAKRRHAPTNRALDACIALEMLMTGGSNEGGGITARIALRAALLLGGTIAERTALRKAVNDVYKLRNRAAHGGSASISETDTLVVQSAVEICDRVARRLIEVGGTIDWATLEINPPALTT
jgi:hypothetical protein